MGLIETGATLRQVHNLLKILSLTCSDRVQNIHLKILVIYYVCTRISRTFNKILRTIHVINCHVLSTILGCGDAKMLNKKVESVE